MKRGDREIVAKRMSEDFKTKCGLLFYEVTSGYGALMSAAETDEFLTALSNAENSFNRSLNKFKRGSK